MTKKILLSLMTIALVGALVGAGVHAYFSDIETAPATFTAGTINLQVGAFDPCTETINISDVKPGWTANAASWTVQNIGTNPGNLSINLSAITNSENVRSEVETAAGDSTEDAGELGTLLKAAFWMDVDKSGSWSSGDYYLNSTGSKVSWGSGTTLPDAAYDILNNYTSDSWPDVQTVAATSEAGNFHVEYNFPEGGSSDNVAQSDSCEFTISFQLMQGTQP